MKQLQLFARIYCIMQVSVKINAGACIFLAVLLLTIPLQWIVATFLSAFFHEVCHIIVIILCHCSVYSIEIGVFGAKIHTSTPSRCKEFICALAGPCGSFLLLCFSRWFPRIALCGLVQGSFNLLPLYPMDGGRMFRCLKEWIRLAIRKIPCKEAQIKVQ